MRGRFAIILSVVLVLALLAALNAASYVRVEREPDSEFRPDRSTTNAGATGTRALYDFLHESGHPVMRWRQPPSALLRGKEARPATFVVVGQVRSEITGDDASSLRRWVQQGGRLVIIDRMPEAQLFPHSGKWRVASEVVAYPERDVRPDDAEAMTAGASLLAPKQPTLLTRGVERVAPSRFASRLIVYVDETETPAADEKTDSGYDEATDDPQSKNRADDAPLKASPSESADPIDNTEAESLDEESSSPPQEINPSPGPVEHIADGRKSDNENKEGKEGNEGSEGALLIDYAYGRGRIVVLSDPFIVSNGGINRADNLQLAVNVVTAGGGGPVAFDEYHQGRGATHNQTLAYFAGTPVLPIAAQAALIVLAVLWTRGRRFARPLPAPRVDRRSNLEFVASMAELQQRARAYDLALENVYGRTLRALARYGNVSGAASVAEIAARVAMRSGKDAAQIESLLRACEEVRAGAHLSAQEALRLVARLRELERELGIRMRERELRQAKI